MELHPEKSQIYALHKGVKFLGFRIFYHYKLLNKRNIRKMENRLDNFEVLYKRGEISTQDVQRSLVSWFGYAQQGNTYKVREQIRKEVVAI